MQSEAWMPGGPALGVALAMAMAMAMAACGSRGRPAGARGPGHDGAPASTPSAQALAVDRPGVVGTLVRNERRSDTNPGEYCVALGQDKQLLRGAPVRVARINVFGLAVEDEGGLVGKHVVVYGERRASLLDALEGLGPCREGEGDDPPMAQMRSDWVAPEGGYATTRSRLSATPYLQGAAVHEVALYRVLADGGDGGAVVVEVTNPFAVALDGLQARAHYEGGPGKPMPKWLPLVLSVPAGGAQRFELAPAIDEAGQPGEPRQHGTYRLHGIDLGGKLGELEVDVSIPLRL